MDGEENNMRHRTENNRRTHITLLNHELEIIRNLFHRSLKEKGITSKEAEFLNKFLDVTDYHSSIGAK